MQGLPAVLLQSLASASAAAVASAADTQAADVSRAVTRFDGIGAEDSAAVFAARAAAEAVRTLVAVLPTEQRRPLWPLFTSGD